MGRAATVSGRRLIRATYVNRVCAYVNGFGSRELLEEVTGRAPMWLARHRAWGCTPTAATDALALAEARGWRTEVVAETHLLMLAGAELAEEKGVLW